MALPTVVVVDDFFSDPDSVRKLALEQSYDDSPYHKGRRSRERFHKLVDEGVIASLLARRMTRWEEHDMNGRFQFCLSTDSIVYHSDLQSHAGIIFLTPGAPIDCGLSIYRSRITGLRRPPNDPNSMRLMYEGNLYDPDQVGGDRPGG
jgi:hypothetical protein